MPFRFVFNCIPSYRVTYEISSLQCPAELLIIITVCTGLNQNIVQTLVYRHLSINLSIKNNDSKNIEGYVIHKVSVTIPFDQHKISIARRNETERYDCITSLCGANTFPELIT